MGKVQEEGTDEGPGTLDCSYYLGDQTKENETDGTCGQCGGDKKCTQCFGGEKVKETGHWEDLGVNGFRRILEK